MHVFDKVWQSPWIRQKVMNQISTSPYFNVPFDDLHNSVLEMEQMDLLGEILEFGWSCFQDKIPSITIPTTVDALLGELFKGLPLSLTIDKMTLDRLKKQLACFEENERVQRKRTNATYEVHWTLWIACD